MCLPAPFTLTQSPSLPVHPPDCPAQTTLSFLLGLCSSNSLPWAPCLHLCLQSHLHLQPDLGSYTWACQATPSSALQWLLAEPQLPWLGPPWPPQPSVHRWVTSCPGGGRGVAPAGPSKGCQSES